MDRASERQLNNVRPLSQLDDWELEHSRDDIRGRNVLSRSGESVGTISDLIVDCEEERVVAVRLGNGRDLPVEPLVIDDEAVILDEPLARERTELEPSSWSPRCRPRPSAGRPAYSRD